ncbi:tRNA (guanine-N(7)-)-methyltransferase [Caprobacter fermentans]|uniref:tRNA (guanine-N(7)-)-methyltransferase n=1 Tax=Caproicibacter fermentans TaxID=2576756 RepID=A0A6N8I2M5_9FIRM|nr:tRNA (guanosine(46)-N7)-methyltransferase TrmB [Caproicibacter fermentans]MVB12386.1 tRNA (guanine-N(7)-)-methyltransferase [Caproicibacter fermentans]OCN03103.1 tRNA (guanosine(46)-N7)-methyltransferase TrmB [Clostridium sp. W14A]
MRMRTKHWAAPELNACPYFYRKPEQYLGRWHSLFARRQPVYLELGCGKGLFLAGAAPRNPQINYLGIDLKDAVLGPARRNIEQAFREAGRPVDNVILTALNIEQIQNAMGPQDQVSRIYIHFCNPWPRKKHKKRRLTHPRQLVHYRQLLVPGGELHFKTDDDELYEDTKEYLESCGFEILTQTKDLYADPPADNIQTEHEKMFLQQGIRIKALTARMLSDPDCEPQPS